MTVLLMLTISGGLKAQLEIKVNPAGAILLMKDVLMTEYMFHERAGVDVKFGVKKSEIDSYDGVTFQPFTYSGYGLEVSLIPKFYLFAKHGGERFYVAPWIRGGKQYYRSSINALVFYNCNIVSVGGLLGYKHILKNNITLEYNIGPGKRLIQDLNFSDDMSEADRNGVTLGTEIIKLDALMTVAIGYRLKGREN